MQNNTHRALRMSFVVVVAFVCGYMSVCVCVQQTLLCIPPGHTSVVCLCPSSCNCSARLRRPSIPSDNDMSYVIVRCMGRMISAHANTDTFPKTILNSYDRKIRPNPMRWYAFAFGVDRTWASEKLYARDLFRNIYAKRSIYIWRIYQYNVDIIMWYRQPQQQQQICSFACAGGKERRKWLRCLFERRLIIGLLDGWHVACVVCASLYDIIRNSAVAFKLTICAQ